MNAREKSNKRDIAFDLCDVVAAINSDPSFLKKDECFWYLIERLTRAIALIDCLPNNLVENTLASKQCLAIFNEYMTDWADGISPPGGWSKDLLTRIPAENVSGGFPYLDI